MVAVILLLWAFSVTAAIAYGEGKRRALKTRQAIILKTNGFGMDVLSDPEDFLKNAFKHQQILPSSWSSMYGMSVHKPTDIRKITTT